VRPHRQAHPPVHRWDRLAEEKKEWLARFLAAKRIVEAFGVEYEPTSEAETMTVHFPMKSQKYRHGIHAEACRQAAKRVVRTWRATAALY
jgi:hypothetical protein